MQLCSPCASGVCSPGAASGVEERARRRRLDQLKPASAESEEPTLDSPGQCVRLADLNGDGRLDVVVSKTVSSSNPNERGGWNVYLNRVK